MTWGLRTYAYSAFSGTWDDITDIASGLTIRSVLHGGVDSIEFQIADHWVDSYRWAYDHIGAKVYIFDNAVNPPVAEGVIWEPGISEDGNRVVAVGPWQAYMFSQHYNEPADWYAAGTTSAQIAGMLTDECPGINSDQTNIAATGTDNYPWQPVENKYPGDYVPYLASLSDASNRDWWFWLRSAPMSGTTPAEPVPFFTYATAITQAYQAWRADMAPGGLDLTPSLRDLGNDVRILRTSSDGIQRQTPSATDADSIARYGLRERWDWDLGMAPGTAGYQYRNALKAKYKDPQQSASFTLNTWLYDQYGGKWPLWRAIADFPFKFTVNDLIPDSTVLGYTLDYKRTFISLECEYDYDSNQLTITPDTERSRADNIISRYRGLK